MELVTLRQGAGPRSQQHPMRNGMKLVPGLTRFRKARREESTPGSWLLGFCELMQIERLTREALAIVIDHAR